jgi:hypothetical protein
MRISPKFCIFGAGAIGGTIAALLTRCGATVSMVAQGETLAALNRNGLRLMIDGEMLQARINGGGASVLRLVGAARLVGANQLLCSFLRAAFAILRALTDQQAPGRAPPRGLQPLSPRASFMAALYARIAIGIDPLSGSRLCLRAQMYAGPSSHSDAADDVIGSGANVREAICRPLPHGL